MKVQVSTKFFDKLKRREANEYVLVEEEVSSKRVLGTFCLTLSLVLISVSISVEALLSYSYESIVENKIVLGNRKEIQEVNNANDLYENINDYNCTKSKHKNL